MGLVSKNSKKTLYKGIEINLPLYLDHQSTTPLAPEVRDSMIDTYSQPGNAESSTHVFGLEARADIENARNQISTLLSCHTDELIFTSGATEANNLALIGYARNFKGKGHIISLATEHDSVLSPLSALKDEGFDVTLIPVDTGGHVNFSKLKAAFRSDTILVSIQTANNEIGTIQNINEIGTLCAARDIAFHTDATQALLTQQTNVHAQNITMLSLSGHKLYGPQGVGALYLKRGTKLKPLIYGGDQQNGMRGGTMPAPLIVGLGQACQTVIECQHKDKVYLLNLSKVLKSQLTSHLKDKVQFNGDQNAALPGCLSITLQSIDAEDLLLEMPELALSTGSACTSSSKTSSHVLKALGMSADAASSTIRIGLGRYVTVAEVEYAANIIINAYNKLK
ncbi:MAG: cysteine desulfurase family protein [Sneathiella sp.]